MVLFSSRHHSVCQRPNYTVSLFRYTFNRMSIDVFLTMHSLSCHPRSSGEHITVKPVTVPRQHCNKRKHSVNRMNIMYSAQSTPNRSHSRPFTRSTTTFFSLQSINITFILLTPCSCLPQICKSLRFIRSIQSSCALCELYECYFVAFVILFTSQRNRNSGFLPITLLLRHFHL